MELSYEEHTAVTSQALRTLQAVDLTDSGLHYVIGWLISTLGARSPEAVESALKSIRESDHPEWYISK